MLAYKVLKQGFYWPTIMEDAINFIQNCDRYQRFANFQRKPSMPITQILDPWPFDIWGNNILGHFPMAKGQRKFLLVVIDYVMKWVEAENLAYITEKMVQDFIWKSFNC